METKGRVEAVRTQDCDIHLNFHEFEVEPRHGPDLSRSALCLGGVRGGDK